MEYSGLTGKYIVNRALTVQELERQLDIKLRLDVEPGHQLSVIRMNSTYIELVDKYFGWKGFLSTFCLVVIAMVGVTFLWLVYSAVFQGWRNTSLGEYLGVFGFCIALFSPLIWLFTSTLKKEAFAYTHYPIRLNRQTRMIHVFRLNGTVLSVPWDELHFCIASLIRRGWEIQGHVLDKDKITVLETFPFMFNGSGEYDRDKALPRYWEFVRRYMEDGPAAFMPKPNSDPSNSYEVKYCLPIAQQRETFKFSMHRVHYEMAGAPRPLTWILLLIYLALYPFRWFAMCTSKIPQWPQDIEDQCVIQPGDPYVRDSSTNP
jgi:hypothetical protein